MLLLLLDPWGLPYSPRPWPCRRIVLSRGPACHLILGGSYDQLAAGAWFRGLEHRPLPNSLHSVHERVDDRSQPCIGDIDSPLLHLVDLSVSSRCTTHTSEER